MKIGLNLDKPEDFRVVKENGELLIYWDFVPTPSEDCPNAYSAEFVRVKGYEYSDIVSAIIKDRYPRDRMESVINNHLDGELEEYGKMQAWRKRAKEIAKLVIDGKEV